MRKFVTSSSGISLNLFGVNLFDYNWNNTREKVEVCDPVYNQKHTFYKYTLTINNQIYTFASGEFSNGVFGVYLEE